MTPQERQLIAELFDRLAALESAPRDPDAERAIAEGLARAPHATYPLVQTVLIQDEALKRANAHIAELEGQDAEPPRQGGFLDNMREALLGRDDRRGSVPSVRPGAASASEPPPAWSGGAPGPSAYYGQPGQPGYGQPGYGQPPTAQPIGTGGSFLGTAAASAAGAIGGAMLLNGIRSMFGHSAGAYEPGLAANAATSPARPASATSAATAPGWSAAAEAVARTCRPRIRACSPRTRVCSPRTTATPTTTTMTILPTAISAMTTTPIWRSRRPTRSLRAKRSRPAPQMYAFAERDCCGVLGASQ